MIRVNTGSYDLKRPRLRVNRNTLATEMTPSTALTRVSSFIDDRRTRPM